VIVSDKRVLVVGGGIGGITAALELASCGVDVTMVEEGPSIGGRMIQLDKTFPTLDCSTCTLSPKMVEVGMNPRVELLSWARPVSMKKNGPGFDVAIRKKSRFVDTKKCTACGSCFPGCPVVMKSEFNMGTGERKAVYIPFPQAIPNKASIDKREERPCKAACVDACPIHTNVLGYLKHISEGRFAEAYGLIRATNPFPSVCGRVCYAPCEKACNRGQLDDPLAIRALKRFAVDHIDSSTLDVPQVQKTGKKVVIIGAGPAGLSAAHDLAVAGHDVTVFESNPEPGGMLRYAIPEYRLPKGELKKEIDYIERLGVAIKCGIEVGNGLDLETVRQSHDALFIAVGAAAGVSPGIDGENLIGVVDGLTFLRDIAANTAAPTPARAAVVGGGNTAVDCARTLRRLGCDSVTLVYRRTRAEMPASDEEVEALLEEGVEVLFLTQPVRLTGVGGKLQAMEYVRMELGEPDASGRKSPRPVEGSNALLDVDMAVFALGQSALTAFAANIGVGLRRNGTIEADPATGATNAEGVFAGGDVCTGPAYVVDAIAAGKRAAEAIDRFLKCQPVETAGVGHAPERLTDVEVDGLKARFEVSERMKTPGAAVDERVTDFREVELGYTEADARREASRCLAGSIEGCIECGECARRCEVGAIDYRMEDDVEERHFDSIVLAPGFDLYDPTEKGEFGYGKLEGVCTGIEFERICSVTGPTGGEIVWKGKRPKRFYFIQCVGSRDRQIGARFCSRVCCMYTAKHASIVKDRVPDAEIYVSYIDVRAYSKSYEEFYKSTQESGVLYIRGIPGEVVQGPGGLLVRVEDMLSGEVREVETDLVVLATGVRPRKETGQLCEIAGVERDDYGFIKVASSIAPSLTNVEGIFVCGMASGPKDVPDTVASGGEAASRCMEYLDQSKEPACQ
jgi:heterodisulfide reductase subunit A